MTKFFLIIIAIFTVILVFTYSTRTKKAGAQVVATSTENIVRVKTIDEKYYLAISRINRLNFLLSKYAEKADRVSCR